jgi:hypothetical protein
MATVIINAQSTIEGLIYTTAVLNLLVLVFLTVKFARVVAEINNLIQHSLLLLLLFRLWHKLFERLLGIILLGAYFHCGTFVCMRQCDTFVCMRQCDTFVCMRRCDTFVCMRRCDTFVCMSRCDTFVCMRRCNTS